MDRVAFQSRLSAAVVNARIARGERLRRGTAVWMSIPWLVAELREKRL